VEPFFEISAAEQLEHRGTGREWGKLVASLRQLVEGSGRRLIRAACDRGLERISEQRLAIVTEEREALPRPIDDSERRIAVMKQTIADAERSMRELAYRPASPRTFPQLFRHSEHPSGQIRALIGFAPET
jgi:hypothetical protein